MQAQLLQTDQAGKKKSMVHPCLSEHLSDQRQLGKSVTLAICNKRLTFKFFVGVKKKENEKYLENNRDAHLKTGGHTIPQNQEFCSDAFPVNFLCLFFFLQACNITFLPTQTQCNLRGAGLQWPLFVVNACVPLCVGVLH